MLDEDSVPDEFKEPAHPIFVPVRRAGEWMVWSPLDVLDQARRWCTRCRPGVPCWRHVRGWFDYEDDRLAVHDPTRERVGLSCSNVHEVDPLLPVPPMGRHIVISETAVEVLCDGCLAELEAEVPADV